MTKRGNCTFENLQLDTFSVSWDDVSEDCVGETVSLALYNAEGPEFDDDKVQTLADSASVVVSAGPGSLQVDNLLTPDMGCFYQTDFIFGEAWSELGPSTGFYMEDGLLIAYKNGEETCDLTITNPTPTTSTTVTTPTPDNTTTSSPPSTTTVPDTTPTTQATTTTSQPPSTNTSQEESTTFTTFSPSQPVVSIRSETGTPAQSETPSSSQLGRCEWDSSVSRYRDANGQFMSTTECTQELPATGPEMDSTQLGFFGGGLAALGLCLAAVAKRWRNV